MSRNLFPKNNNKKYFNIYLIYSLYVYLSSFESNNFICKSEILSINFFSSELSLTLSSKYFSREFNLFIISLIDDNSNCLITEVFIECF